MNDQNLIPLNKRSKKEQREIQSRGGLANKNNPNSRIAAKLRELKKKGLTDETSKRLYEIMTDPAVNDLDNLMYIESIKSIAKTPKEKEMVAKLNLEFRKIRHGTNEAKNQINIQQNFINDIDKEEIKKVVEDIKNRYGE